MALSDTSTENLESSRLFEMFADLARDPEALERFRSEEGRKSIMNEYELTEGQQALLNQAIDESNHDLERYAHIAKLIGDAAEVQLIPLC